MGNAFSIVIVIVISILLTILGLVFVYPLLTMFGASDNIIGYSKDFIQIIFIECIFNLMSFGLNHSIRSDGSPIIVTVGFIVIEGFAEKLVIIFNNNPSLVEVTSHGIRIFLMMLPFVGAQIIITNYFQSIGKVKISMLLSLLRQVIILIPCMLIIQIFKGLDGVWIAGTIADLLSVIITFLVFMKISKGLIKNEKEQTAALED